MSSRGSTGGTRSNTAVREQGRNNTPSRLIKRHRVQEWGKVRDLKTSMEREGWKGAPLVRLGNRLLTGVHRITAVRQLGWPMSRVPTVTIQSVFREAGMDFRNVWSAAGKPRFGDRAPGDDDERFSYDVLYKLPYDIRRKYGLD